MIKPTAEKKNRRLRKKLYLGEFAILGFELSCKVSSEDTEAFERFVGEFIDFADEKGFCFGGGGYDEFEGFLCAAERYGSLTEEDRESVKGWLTSQAQVSDVVIGELVDVVYDY